MRYISTRGRADPLTFTQAVMTGLARDGGLLLPERIPQVGGRLAEWSRLAYEDLAVAVMALFADRPADDLASLVRRSYRDFPHPDVTPVVPWDDGFILELFHGPTLSFKDLALQFLGGLFETILAETGASLNIVAATSGDTGSAAIHGVRGRPGLRIFVMHPRGRISRSQELQMTTVRDGNVFNLAIEGTFDDCQRILKSLLGDAGLRDRCSLGAVNSINWARVLAQIVYYFYAAFRVMERTGASRVAFTVPTGNFGDIFAGYLAARMGLPLDRLVLATNENDIMARCFATGVYSRGEVRETLSPSMDIQVASNFERYLYYRFGENGASVADAMRDFAASGRLRLPPGEEPWIVAGSADTGATLETIRRSYAEHGYLLDPHTAVGVHVGRSFRRAGIPMIYLATAHPAKFGEAMARAIGKDVARHAAIDRLTGLPTACTVLPADEAAVRNYVEGVLGQDHGRNRQDFA